MLSLTIRFLLYLIVENKLKNTFLKLSQYKEGGYVCIRDYDDKFMEGGIIEFYNFFKVRENYTTTENGMCQISF